ncbi:hypothetical protein CW751_11060 [Brumimicrobium salinarum]|uniref:Solute-binding protein family 5 domain-containing protein n=1 Tax=Brumimicrobium salinarum TaxID=2058658 RepID=A0A2I0R0U1_9FLAO|nr:peptide ABC transporter substrate-binding protein [Brumimicrobium salinarum]PKR80194.1 hypothetical protein CW751_11060 [Brumimicrobium salinarum]
MSIHSIGSKYLFKLQVLFVFSIVTLISSCSNIGGNKEFEHAGGSFSMAMGNEPSTYLARNVSDVYTAIFLNQIYERLVTFDPQTLEVVPSLAKSWEISEDGKTIQLEIRDDVYFHPHDAFPQGIKLTPEDIVYSIELSCKPYKGNESYAYTIIYKGILKGADEFYQGKADNIEGLSIKDNTVTIELVERDINYLNKLALTNAAIVSKKVVEAGYETDLIGTGAFKYSQSQEVDGRVHMTLLKNNNYYGKDKAGNQLPYLDSLILKVEPRNLRQLEMFENNEIQLIDGLPPSRISMMLDGKIDDFNSTPPKLILTRKPLLATQYYHFNLLREEFQDVRVRQAINYAINRDDIVRDVLNNQAFSKGNGGIVPPAAFSGYNSSMVKKHAYDYNPEKAKKLMAEAGYPNAEGFPSINIKFNIGSNHSAVADKIAKQLKKVLNINVSLDGLKFQDRLNDQENANGQIFRSSWFADYYSPESFLMSAFGGNVPQDPSEPSPSNHSRYKNDAYDAELIKAKSATDIIKRYEHFAAAERILMQDAPFVVLWYEETIKIIYSKVRNLHINEMNYYTFNEVYIKDWTKKEWEERQKNNFLFFVPKLNFYDSVFFNVTMLYPFSCDRANFSNC